MYMPTSGGCFVKTSCARTAMIGLSMVVAHPRCAASAPLTIAGTAAATASTHHIARRSRVTSARARRGLGRSARHRLHFVAVRLGGEPALQPQERRLNEVVRHERARERDDPRGHKSNPNRQVGRVYRDRDEYR